MKIQIETKNQKLLLEKLQVGYELITYKNGVYLIAKEVNNKAHIITIKNGEISNETIIDVKDIQKMIANTTGTLLKGAQ